MCVKNFAEILSLDLTRKGKINFENLGAMTLGCLMLASHSCPIFFGRIRCPTQLTSC